MCGIAGVIDLSGRRPVPATLLTAMADALTHRGPDDVGFLQGPGLGLTARRLSIVDVAGGHQPMANEDQSVSVVFNGEIYEAPDLRAQLTRRGHRLTSYCDTEVIPHLWEESQEGMFSQLRGQFALALWDQARQRLILARDRFGICPLYWARSARDGGDWLVFASEIKALLDSGLIEPRADVRGLDNIFTFFALPGPSTCFEGVQALLPGHYLRIQRGATGEPARISDHCYWELEFPDRGQEQRGEPKRLVDDFEELLIQAVDRRLQSDLPVVAYLSGGVDSSLILALASRRSRAPRPSFTIQIGTPELDETRQATAAARYLGGVPIVVACNREEILGAYPRLIQAAEAPVSDTCCAALLQLAREVHDRGYKVALTGEGSDESLAGYPWYKWQRLLKLLDMIPGLPLSEAAWRLFLRRSGGVSLPRPEIQRAENVVGGDHAWQILYGLVSLSRGRFYSPELRRSLDDYSPWADLGLNRDRFRRWHPLNQALYLGLRIHLPGLLLSLAGDRVAMHSSVETRYPFLDEDVVGFLASLAPSWKLKGWREKYLLRLLAERWLPQTIAWRPKAMFQAPFDSLYSEPAPTFVEQLLSEPSLRKTGYFDLPSIRFWRQAFPKLRPGSARHFSVAIGLSAVVATQLWHHTFLDGSLADLPSRRGTAQPRTTRRVVRATPEGFAS
jgi:asparagine synthase (glutamine-hydrolysing)